MSDVPIVVDLGSATWKGGLAGSEKPVSFIPVAWRPMEADYPGEPPDVAVGDSINPEWRGICQFPYQRGCISGAIWNWLAKDDIERFFPTCSERG